jgi:hypothetical protein
MARMPRSAAWRRGHGIAASSRPSAYPAPRGCTRTRGAGPVQLQGASDPLDLGAGARVQAGVGGSLTLSQIQT